MANHPQAKKRNRQRIKQTARNRHIRTTMRTSVKRVRTLIEKGDLELAKTALGVAVKNLDKAAVKGVLHRRTASRTISRLSIAVNKLIAKA
ncbi:MAG: 30S ribosomal protein S20 [Myxococcota bacterium]|nr:30S ribosomal protein S20 [Myxococcota bacterium]